MNEVKKIQSLDVVAHLISDADADDMRIEVFQDELNRRWISFNIDDAGTWPSEDGLFLGITFETGRIGAIVLQWAGSEPTRVWRSVNKYIELVDILPTKKGPSNG